MSSTHGEDNSSALLEEAIETLHLFTHQHVGKKVATLEDFEIQNGSFELCKRTRFKKTFSLLARAVSEKLRKEKKGKLNSIKAKLLDSVDTIKIALMKLKNGHLLNHELKERMLSVVHRYNAIVADAKKTPSSFTEKIKYFFFKRADSIIDDEMVQSIICIPQNVFYHASKNKMSESKKNFQHKFSYHIPDATSEKIGSSICITNPEEEAHRQELELFRLKAQALLRKEVLPHTHLEGSLHDAMPSLISSPIETSLSANSILSLKQTISTFPGEEIELHGAFSRSRGISIPIKDMFQISSQSLQTGFPHPLQYTGFAFSEKLLPSYFLRPHLAPHVELVLKKKRKIAEELLPTGGLNTKAKALLHLRKKVWKTHQKELCQLLRKQLLAIFQSGEEKTAPVDELFEKLEKNSPLTLTFFEKLSQVHQTVVKRFVTHPISVVEELWVQDTCTSTEKWEKTYFNEIEKAKKELVDRYENCQKAEEKAELFYKLSLGNLIGKNSYPIFALISSEKQQFAPKFASSTLTTFQKKMVASIFYQITAFHHELDHLDTGDKEVENKLYRSIVTSLEKEIQLFSSPDDPQELLVKELEQYYNLRHLT